MNKFDEKFGFVWPHGAPEILPPLKHIYRYTVNNPFVPKKPMTYAYTKKQIYSAVEEHGKFMPHVPEYELESAKIKRRKDKG